MTYLDIPWTLVAVALWCGWCFVGDMAGWLALPAWKDTKPLPTSYGGCADYPSDAPTIVRK